MNRTKLILLILTAFVVFASFINFGPRVANDFPLVNRETLLERFDIPQFWTDSGAVGFGEYALSTAWGWPQSFLYGLGAKLGLGFAALERLLGIFPVVLLSLYSINKLLTHYKIKGRGRVVGSLFYLLNTYVLLLIDGGQFGIALAYAFFPLAFLLVTKSLKGKATDKVIAGLAVSAVGFSDIRFVYVLAIILFLSFLYEMLFAKSKLRLIKNWVITAFIASFVFAGLNAYWILPAILVKAPALPETYQRLSQTSFLSFANIGHAMLLLQPHWFRNVFGKVIELRAEFYLIPILVFSAPMLVTARKQPKKAKAVGFWLMTALFGIFLVKGANPPLPQVYPWMFSNIPGFSLFRDPTKFYFLIALSYSVLIGVTSEALIKRFDWSLKIASGSVSLLARKGNWSYKFIPLLLIIYYLLLIRPIWTGQMTGTFSPPYNLEQFEAANKILSGDKGFGRVLWLPSLAPMGYSSPSHPALEASRIYAKRPFASGVVGSYEVFNFLREAPYMGEIFDVSGIKYIIYPYPDTRREELKSDNVEYYYAFLDQLSNLPWVENKLNDAPVPILKTKKTQDHIFTAQNTYYLVGTDEFYEDMINLGGTNLSNNAVIFAEEKPDVFPKQNSYNDIKIIAFNKNEFDVIASLLPADELIFPSGSLPFSPYEDGDKTGWWKRETTDYLWFRNFLQEKYGNDFRDFDYGGGVAIAEGEKELTILNNKFKRGDRLYVRMLGSSKGGAVNFYQEDQPINGTIATNGECLDKIDINLSGYGDIADQTFTYDCADLFWVYVGELQKEAVLTIKTAGEINAINAILSVSENEIEDIRKLVSDKIIYWNQLTDDEKTDLLGLNNAQYDISIYHTKISPTHYRITVENVNQPFTLILSESYDPLWEISNPKTSENSSSYPVYGLLNGFYIENNGEYDIYYSPQKYVLPGLAISALTLVSVMGILVLRKRRV